MGTVKSPTVVVELGESDQVPKSSKIKESDQEFVNKYEERSSAITLCHWP